MQLVGRKEGERKTRSYVGRAVTAVTGRRDNPGRRSRSAADPVAIYALAAAFRPTSSSEEPHGWGEVVQPALGLDAIAAVSNDTLRLTLPPAPRYSIVSDELIRIELPAPPPPRGYGARLPSFGYLLSPSSGVLMSHESPYDP